MLTLTPRLDEGPGEGNIFSEDWQPVIKELAEVLGQVRALLEGLKLFGTERVQVLANGFDALLLGNSDGDVRVALIRGPTAFYELQESPLFDHWRFGGTFETWNDELLKLSQAMREDVAPKPVESSTDLSSPEMT